ncbi:MAG: DUF3419 family protein, partial [Clostridia bacterium]|nr:DUF3419 family protein [Clostridia bacterium]
MVKKKVLSDIDKAKEVISDFISTHEYKKEHKFIRPYLHSNEGDFYKNIDVKGKDVLTVGSSCDQSLYSILYGANSVTLFDLNPFVQYVYDLKVAAIQRFPMLLTRQLFTINPQHTSIDFSKAVEKLAPLMSEESQFFWSSIGNDFSHKEIITGLFDQYGSRYPHFLQNPIAYQDLRSKLASTPYINFVSSSLHDLPQNLPMGSQFDIALISNVQDYYEDDIYKQDIKQIMPFMRQNGIMQLNYSYNYPKTPNNIYHPDKLDNINELFGVQAINGKIYPHLT